MRARWLIAVFGALIFGGSIWLVLSRNHFSWPISQYTVTVTPEKTAEPMNQRIDFSTFNSSYRFSAELPDGWQAKAIAASDSIAIFSTSDTSNLDAAVLFIRHFSASDFQTLTTVNVLAKEPTTVNGHATVRYEIEKKAEVANFADQPAWRSSKHKLTDVRFAETKPSLFYVFAYNPALPANTFETFLVSLQFHNDAVSFRSPLDRTSERVSKKSFGTKVSPTNSPVSPEKFSGYHTGWDFEIFPDELEKDISVTAFCGGPVKATQTSSGYGGVVVQDCQIGADAVTIIYGHLRLQSVTAAISSYLAPGSNIGLLGTANSSETDGERKHLHFGIHRGSGLNIKGYVSSQADLAGWLNPDDYL